MLQVRKDVQHVNHRLTGTNILVHVFAWITTIKLEVIWFVNLVILLVKAVKTHRYHPAQSVI